MLLQEYDYDIDMLNFKKDKKYFKSKLSKNKNNKLFVKYLGKVKLDFVNLIKIFHNLSIQN